MKFRSTLYCLTALIGTALLLASISLAQDQIKDIKPTVILISLDGFRYDYLDRFKPATLSRLAQEGVRAKWMIPSFPTKTFPNHYAIATGLYPEHNGIVENNIWDFGTTFTLNKREEVQNSRWWLGEPIWVTAEKQNERAAAFFFPGSEAAIQGVRPTYWKAYDGKIHNDERVDSVLGWLDKPQAERPQMILMYFSDTDEAGHEFSPDSEQVKDAVGREDGAIARLLDGMRKRGIDDSVNVIIVSDHGMATVDQHNAVVLDKYFDLGLAERILWTGEIVQIFPKADKEAKIMNGLGKIEHATCWRKNDVPTRLHYNEGDRIAAIVCTSEEGWELISQDAYEKQKQRPDFGRPRGAHGYDNKYREMMATFIARGPAFKSGFVAEPFENIQVYNVMCKILGLKPAKNDGNLDVVMGMLR